MKVFSHVKSTSVTSNGTGSDSSDMDMFEDAGKRHIPRVTKRRAYRICREFVGGAWKRITLADFTLEAVSGGLSNLLYLCSLSEAVEDEADGPRQLMLRVHCQIHDSRMEENIIFTILSERLVGPKLYGVFDEGRIEEYIPKQCLQQDDLAVPEISLAIAARLATVHHLQIPISKNPRWISEVLDRWIRHTRKQKQRHFINGTNKHLCYLLDEAYEEEAKFVKIITSCQSEPVVFCHNDLQEGNIFNIGTAADPSMVFIDYEYCSYNYRSFDIANHFIEWSINYKIPTYPHFQVDESKLPSEDEQRRFIRAYLQASAHIDRCHPVVNGVGDGVDKHVEEISEEEKILALVPVYMMASDLVYCLWSIVQADISPVTFGYLEFAEARWKQYKKGKEKLLQQLYIA